MTTVRRNQIKEFCSAVLNPFSYKFSDNVYIWFGILWGLPIPIVTLLLDTHHLIDRGLSDPLLQALQSPIQWFFLAHPIMFAVVFGALGTIRFEKERQLNDVISQLQNLSTHDPLTGLKNRRFFAHNFHDECARSIRRQESIYLLFLDLDHFKTVNDKHGHHIGDIVLKETAALLKSQCRPYDIPVRWGGEEFLVLIRADHQEAAKSFAERLRQKVESGEMFSIDFPITISIGIAEYQVDDTLEIFVERADKALYKAKQTGRNRVICQ
jgi:diguanylate cyclase (GGDEF)-like protein